MVVIVTGARDYVNARVIEDALVALAQDGTQLEVVHGDAPGADSLADKIARKIHAIRHAYPAQWWRFQDRAGPIRNRLMLTLYPAATVYAFHDDLEHSRGTIDMINQAMRTGRRVVLYTKGYVIDQPTLPLE